MRVTVSAWRWTAAYLLAFPVMCQANGPLADSMTQRSSGLPRMLMLPWMVIDRTTNRSFTHPDAVRTPAAEEVHRLTHSAQSALDAVLHRHGGLGQLIPRSEWEPLWDRLKPGEVVWPGTGCAACTPVGHLIRYDRATIQRLAGAVRADYVWLGVAVVPLTPGAPNGQGSDCCRDALAQEQDAVLARSSVLIVRVRDGEIVWQRDARRLDRDVLRRSSRPIYPPPSSRSVPGPFTDTDTQARPPGPDRSSPSQPIWYIYSPAERREMAVDDTAHRLGKAFLRVHREVLR